MTNRAATYQVDHRWKIVRASEAFCRALRCTEPGLMGRDVRDLMPADWRLEFRTYVARALVGVGDSHVTLPMVSPCGEQGWYRHTLEPILEDAGVIGYRAAVVPHLVPEAAPAAPWWEVRVQAQQMVWNYDAQPL